MSFRRYLVALLLALAVAAAPSTFAAEQAKTAGFWQAFTDWLIASLGLGEEAEGGYGIVPGGISEGGYGIEPGGRAVGAELGPVIFPGGNSAASQAPPEEPEGGYGILPGG